MNILIYVFSASFILMACALGFTWYRTRHVGMLIMAVTYGAAGALAIVITDWWPLVAGFGLVWAFKLMGLDPGTKIAQPDGQKEQP